MTDYEVGDHVAYEKLRENVLAWSEGRGDVDFEEYIRALMDSESSEDAVFHDLQAIGLELGWQGGDEASADTLFERILEADDSGDGSVFGLSRETAEHAFYDAGYSGSR
jgi:hypothetical protein